MALFREAFVVSIYLALVFGDSVYLNPTNIHRTGTGTGRLRVDGDDQLGDAVFVVGGLVVSGQTRTLHHPGHRHSQLVRRKIPPPN